MANGLTWDVLPAGCDELYPGLAELLQEAFNQQQKSAKSDDDREILYRGWAKANASFKANEGTVEWPTVTKELLSSEPACAKDVPEIIKYLKRWGGGPESPFVPDITAYCQQFVDDSRIVPGYTYGVLAGLKFPAGTNPGHFVAAVVKTQASAPQAHVHQNVSKYISGQAINALCGKEKMPEVVRADKIMSKAKKIANDASCPPHVLLRLAGADACYKHYERLAITSGDLAFGDSAFGDPAFGDPAFRDPAFGDPVWRCRVWRSLVWRSRVWRSRVSRSRVWRSRLAMPRLAIARLAIPRCETPR